MKKLISILAVVALFAVPAMATMLSDVQLLAQGSTNTSGGTITNHPAISGTWFSGSVTLKVVDTDPGSGVSDPVGMYAAGQTFRSFCIEFDEHVNWNTTYDVTGVDSYASKGGLAGGNPDYLSKETAWLYRSFINGTLASATYDGINTVGYSDGSAGNLALQKAVWYSEDEWVNSSGNRVAFTSGSLEDKLVRAATWNATQADLSHVGVVNLDPNGAATTPPVQSFLITIPEPGTGLLVLIGLGIAAWVRKRPA